MKVKTAHENTALASGDKPPKLWGPETASNTASLQKHFLRGLWLTTVILRLEASVVPMLSEHKQQCCSFHLLTVLQLAKLSGQPGLLRAMLGSTGSNLARAKYRSSK
jgi:hypothetical protein